MKLKRFISALFAVLIFLFTAAFSFAQTVRFEPRLEPDPKAFILAKGFEPTQWRSLFELAYWGSGASDWQAAADDFAPVLSQLSEEVSSMDERARAEAVLEFMHEYFLKTYREKQSDFDLLLSSGRFNCLSSAVLYAIMGTAVGLDVSGVNTIDHAFCSVRIDDELIDVETTNAYGFDPGTKQEFQDGFGKTTGFAYVPPANYRGRNSIDLLTLFSLLLQNRIADAEDAGRYYEAVGLAVDRWILLGGGPGEIFEDLVIRMLNYGTMLSRAGREEDALIWAEQGIAVYGSHPKWDDFVDGLSNNLLIKLIRSGKLDDARRRLDELKSRLSPDAAASLELMVSDSELIAGLDRVKAGGSDSDFLILLNRIKEGGAVSDERILEIEVNWRLYRIDSMAEFGGWTAAYKAVEMAVNELGSHPQLERALRVYLTNIKAGKYNAIVETFNDGRYNEAHSLARTAILEFPNDRNLKSLLEKIERAVAGN